MILIYDRQELAINWGYKYPQTANQAIWKPSYEDKVQSTQADVEQQHIKAQIWNQAIREPMEIKITQFTQKDIQQQELKSNKSTQTDLAA